MATKNGPVKVSAVKPKNPSFKKRKDCIKKKTMELSVLCDVKACALIIGPDGKLETWPENSHDVLEVLGAFRNSNSRDSKRIKKVAEDRNEVALVEVPVPEDQWLPGTSGAALEGKQGLPSTSNAVREKEQEGFPLTILNVANQEEHGLPRMLNADHQEEQRFPGMLNAIDESELEFKHDINEWFNLEDYLDDSIALNQPEFDAWMNSEHDINEWFNLEDYLDDSIALNQQEFDAWMNSDLDCYDDHHITR